MNTRNASHVKPLLQALGNHPSMKYLKLGFIPEPSAQEELALVCRDLLDHNPILEDLEFDTDLAANSPTWKRHIEPLLSNRRYSGKFRQFRGSEAVQRMALLPRALGRLGRLNPHTSCELSYRMIGENIGVVVSALQNIATSEKVLTERQAKTQRRSTNSGD